MERFLKISFIFMFNSFLGKCSSSKWYESFAKADIVLPHKSASQVETDPSILLYMGSSFRDPSVKNANLYGWVESLIPGIDAGDFTLSAWIITGKRNASLFNLGNPSNNDNHHHSFNFFIDDAGRLNFWDNFQKVHHSRRHSGSDIIVSDNKWKHVAFVKKNVIGIFYVDGVESGILKFPTSIPYINSNFCVAMNCGGTNLESQAFEGAMDIRIVFNRALVAAEVLYLKSIRPKALNPCPDNIKYTKFIHRIYDDLTTRIQTTTALKHVLLDKAYFSNRKSFFVEFGVWYGSSINTIAKAYPSNVNIYGFDSFEGLPETWVYPFVAGSFDMKGQLPRVHSNVKLIKGWFNSTLPKFKSEVLGDQKISLIHIDCDLYSSATFVLTTLKDNIGPGTYIVFDELINFIGFEDHEMKAFYEFIQMTKYKFEVIGAECSGSCQPVAVRIL